ncbi:MAG: cofactor-independent phosphoglycerate mutase [Phycisphaerae bacterium]
MKYALIIPDGAADEPIASIGDKTPLQVAETPNMDWIAQNGRVGTVKNVPQGLPCGSDVAILSLLGYDPKEHYTGRAPLEAAAQGIDVGADEWVFRCNLVTIVDGLMEDHSAGHITTKEATAIIEEFNEKLAAPGLKFYPGVSYRHLMTYEGELNITTTPPHDILGKNASGYLPGGQGAEKLRTLIQLSQEILENHDINVVRRDLGENPATSMWLWGEGKMPNLPRFEKLFGIKGAAITAVDLIRGISKLIDWNVIEVQGATGNLDTNYEGKGAAAVKALDDHDIVCVHVEAPDECGHAGDVSGKVKAITEIDKHVVGPVVDRLKKEGDDWRILVLPDHPTPIEFRTHTAGAVPFALAGKRIEAVVHGPFCEATGEISDLHIPRGCELMEFFLTVR